jgi:catechol 2,3-dioxygenase
MEIISVHDANIPIPVRGAPSKQESEQMTNSSWRGQLSHIGLQVADAARSAEFYVDVLGLSVRGVSPDGAHVRLGWPTGQHALDLFTGPRGLDHFSLEITDPRELEEVVGSLTHAGQDVEHRAADAGQPASHAVRDPEGRLLELHGRVDRSGELGSTMARRPVRLQHITFATAQMDDLLEFYVGVMGFRVSDRMGSIFTWLRCGAEHHTVAMVESDSGTLDHFSFDVGGWEDFKAWGDHLSRYGVPLTWGPGRHGPGNNLFVMFDDPDHHHVELSSEMENYFDDLADYQPRQWRPEQRTVNLWGPAPAWRVPRAAELPASDSGTA